MKCNPNNLRGLKDSDTSRTAAELREYVHGVNWISTSIPRFSERVAPLRELLKVSYVKAGSNRKKKEISKFEVTELEWNSKQDSIYKYNQQKLQESVKPTHRDPNTSLCIPTDASDKYWAVCATKCTPAELSKPIMEQSHKPLAFLSGTFSDSE